MQEKAAAPRIPEAARRYHALRHRLFFFCFFLDAASLFLFVASGWSRYLKISLERFAAGPWLLNALYFTVFSAAAFCLSLPLSFYEGFILEHRFGLSRQGARDWLSDMLKKGGLSFLVGFVCAEALYFFLRRFAQTWWLLAAFFWFFVSVVLARLSPNILLPLFFKKRQLEDGPLLARLRFLFQKSGLRCGEIFVLDFSKKTVKANALVTGIGSTKRIFLGDTLLKDFSDDEIEAVVAHELGHYLKGDTFKLIAAGFAVSLVSCFGVSRALAVFLPRFGFRALDDVAAFPLLLLGFMVSGLLLAPLQNAFSRHLEIKADRFALALTGNVEAFVSLMARLGAKNLADPAPPLPVQFFFYDHPPISTRIKLAHAHG